MESRTGHLYFWLPEHHMRFKHASIGCLNFNLKNNKELFFSLIQGPVKKISLTYLIISRPKDQVSIDHYLPRYSYKILEARCTKVSRPDLHPLTIWDPPNSCHKSGTILIFTCNNPFILTITLRSKCCHYLYFTNEEIEAQRP